MTYEQIHRAQVLRVRMKWFQDEKTRAEGELKVALWQKEQAEKAIGQAEHEIGMFTQLLDETQKELAELD